MKWVIMDVNMFHCSVLWLCHSSWRFPDKTMKSASVNLELPNTGRSNPKSDLKILYFLKICPIFFDPVHTTKHCKVASRIISLWKVSLQILQKSNLVTNHMRPSLEPVCCKKQQKKSSWQVSGLRNREPLKDLNDSKLTVYESSYYPDHPRSILYHLESSEDPYSTNHCGNIVIINVDMYD